MIKLVHVLSKYEQTSNQGIILPPNMERISIDYYCRKEMLQARPFYFFKLYTCENDLKACHFQALVSKGDITVFAVAPHAHLAGKEIYVKQIRNGKEIAYLAENKYFSLSVQSLLFLQTPVILKMVLQNGFQLEFSD